MMAFEMVEKAKDLGRKQATTQGNLTHATTTSITLGRRKSGQQSVSQRSVRAPEVIDTIHEGMGPLVIRQQSYPDIANMRSLWLSQPLRTPAGQLSL